MRRSAQEVLLQTCRDETSDKQNVQTVQFAQMKTERNAALENKALTLHRWIPEGRNAAQPGQIQARGLAGGRSLH